MTIYRYRPNHPKANKNGMVDAALIYAESGPAPYVISDTMEAIKHMGSGRMIDSKAKFRAETKATGCIEVGNEKITARKPIPLDRRQRREDIGRAIYELRNKSVSR